MGLFFHKGEGFKFASVDLKQQNLPIKFHKYKKHSLRFRKKKKGLFNIFF